MSPPVPDKALEVLATTHYTQAVGAPAAARSRAQTAYTVASATAGALVTAGAIAGITEYPALVQVLGVTALASWLLVAALFMEISREARWSNPDADEVETLTDDEVEALTDWDFVSSVLTESKVRSEEVDRRLNRVLPVTWLALGLTTLTFVSTLVLPVEPDTADATVLLSPSGAKVVSALCEHDSTSIEGEVREGTLDDDYVVIEVPPPTCGDETKTLLLQPADISGASSGEEDATRFPWLGGSQG